MARTPKPKKGRPLNLVHAPDQPLPGPKTSLAKAGVTQKATTLSQHKTGGLKGLTNASSTYRDG